MHYIQRPPPRLHGVARYTGHGVGRGGAGGAPHLAGGGGSFPGAPRLHQIHILYAPTYRLLSGHFVFRAPPTYRFLSATIAKRNRFSTRRRGTELVKLTHLHIFAEPPASRSSTVKQCHDGASNWTPRTPTIGHSCVAGEARRAGAGHARGTAHMAVRCATSPSSRCTIAPASSPPRRRSVHGSRRRPRSEHWGAGERSTAPCRGG